MAYIILIGDLHVRFHAKSKILIRQFILGITESGMFCPGWQKWHGVFCLGSKSGMKLYVRGGRNGMGCFVGVSEITWDVLTYIPFKPLNVATIYFAGACVT